MTAAADTSPLLGGRYRLGGVLGRGGVAAVYRAHDEVLGRDVAVKLLPGYAGPDDTARLDGELRALAPLSHPGLVPLYDAGQDDGRTWLVMELVDGPSLATVLRERVLSPREGADLGAEVAAALAYVHARGMVHRDVKPGNVLLGRDGRVRLADFGLARLADSTGITGTGFIAGTAAYLAPEQVRGERAGPAADVYALGLVVLEAITGRREYDGTPAEVAVARLHRRPAVDTDLRAGLREALLAATETDPERRPSAADLAAALTASRDRDARAPDAADEPTVLFGAGAASGSGVADGAQRTGGGQAAGDWQAVEAEQAAGSERGQQVGAPRGPTPTLVARVPLVDPVGESAPARALDVDGPVESAQRAPRSSAGRAGSRAKRQSVRSVAAVREAPPRGGRPARWPVLVLGLALLLLSVALLLLLLPRSTAPSAPTGPPGQERLQDDLDRLRQAVTP